MCFKYRTYKECNKYLILLNTKWVMATLYYSVSEVRTLMIYSDNAGCPCARLSGVRGGVWWPGQRRPVKSHLLNYSLHLEASH